MSNPINQINENLQATLGFSIEEIEKKIQSFNPEIFIVKSNEDIEKILTLRDLTYSHSLTEVNYKDLESMDFHSIIMYSKDREGNIASTSRLVIDSSVGFAEDYVYKKYIQQYREQDQLLAEWGRCIVSQSSKVSALDYAHMIEMLAKDLGIRHVLIFNRKCDARRILKTLDNTKVLEQTDISLGSRHIFTAMLWSFPKDNSNSASIYSTNTWSEYAKSFMTITSYIQSELLREAVKHISGSIIDCGSGSAKLAPYLRHRGDVLSYTAIDYCPVMCQYGLDVLDKVNRENFSIVESDIQSYASDALYDSAVSINSFYTWLEPQKNLQHIYNLLKPNGTFVLATINSTVDMERLIEEGEPDLIMHPDVEKFRAINQQLALNKNANLISLDDIIREVHQAGFNVLKSHNNFYLGGLSFLVLTKGSH